MTPSDTVIQALHETVQSLRDRNDTLRIENDHLRAELVNMTRDNAGLLTKIRTMEAHQSACSNLRCQGFTIIP